MLFALLAEALVISMIVSAWPAMSGLTSSKSLGSPEIFVESESRASVTVTTNTTATTTAVPTETGLGILRSSIAPLFALSTFLTGVFLADRERYVHGFRQADLHFFEQVLRLRELESLRRQPAYNIAKMWLRHSEDFRRTAVYLTFSCVHLSLSTIFFLAALIVGVLFSEWYFAIPYGVAMIFLVLSLMAHLGRYWSGRGSLRSFWSSYKRMSWWLSERFPPISPPLAPSHLARWREIGEAVEQDDEFGAYLRTLSEYKDLEMFAEYVKAQRAPYFNF